ncbi:MAG TPA: NfeD family protein [Parvibaculum sp.]|jgi:membrane protein implicated in regulation of membrane protease activity|uniref:NfeD family protein n=1 Tax=Parvibaculum sp. TaxID=2024848 RepID=UPI002C621513|nr:NfeD family protein [Parvibaculum sp.]HMM15898.1 NfeD family protein [Parvibaculum sp.]
MESESSLLSVLGPWAWWIAAAAFAILELLAPGVFFIWLAAAAAGVGLVMLIASPPVAVQIALFSVLAVAAVWGSRRFLTKHPIESDRPLLNLRAEGYIGQVFMLEQAIHNGRGKVRIGDTLWLAQGPELAAGSAVRVVSADGNILIVEAA